MKKSTPDPKLVKALALEIQEFLEKKQIPFELILSTLCCLEDSVCATLDFDIDDYNHFLEYKRKTYPVLLKNFKKRLNAI